MFVWVNSILTPSSSLKMILNDGLRVLHYYIEICGFECEVSSLRL